MAHIPANWQRVHLDSIVEASRLSLDDFEFRGIRDGYAQDDTGFAYVYGQLPEAVFSVDWRDYSRSAAGYGGRPPKGKWYVTQAPGREDPLEEYNGLPWDDVVLVFTKWVGYLEREVHATRHLETDIVSLRLLPAPPDTTEGISDDEIDLVEPILQGVYKDFVDILGEDVVTSAELDGLRVWLETEIADVRAELRRQSKRGFRRTVIGFGANVAMKFGPDIWSRMSPAFENLLGVLDSMPRLTP